MPNPFVHVELNTGDVATAQKFYKALFDWKFREIEPGYFAIDVGEGTGGGMQKKPIAESPTMWLPYVLVDDVKKTSANVEKNGGNVVIDYMPIDGMGALGVFIDPTGAPLGIWEPTEMKAEKAPAKKGAPAKKTSAKKAAPAKKTSAKKAAPAKKTSAKKR